VLTLKFKGRDDFMVRMGVIGTSWITESFLQNAVMVEGFKLKAVYSRNEDKARALAEKYNADHIFTNLSEMAESNLIDAVYIASPNSLHAGQAIEFLRRGKHVLCEKPIASNLRELNLMIETARSNNLLLMEAMKSTFLPNFKVIEENLDKLGKIRRFFANYCQYSSRYDLVKQGQRVNIFDPEFSGGSLMDIGVYCVYPMVKLFGMPKEIKASAFKLGSGVDGLGSLILSYDEMEGVIIHSKITHTYIPSEIQGENGSMVIDRIDGPRNVQIYYRDGNTEDLTVPQDMEQMYYEVREFIELIESNKTESAINSYLNSINTMKVMDAARAQCGIVFKADLR